MGVRYLWIVELGVLHPGVAGMSAQPLLLQQEHSHRAVVSGVCHLPLLWWQPWKGGGQLGW